MLMNEIFHKRTGSLIFWLYKIFIKLKDQLRIKAGKNISGFNSAAVLFIMG